MKPEGGLQKQTRFYKLGLLEKSLFEIRNGGRFLDSTPLYFTPAQKMCLLTAIRLGMITIYEHPELLDEVQADKIP